MINLTHSKNKLELFYIVEYNYNIVGLNRYISNLKVKKKSLGLNIIELKICLQSLSVTHWNINKNYWTVWPLFEQVMFDFLSAD